MQNQWPIVPLGDVDERMENLLVDIKTVSLVKGIRQKILTDLRQMFRAIETHQFI